MDTRDARPTFLVRLTAALVVAAVVSGTAYYCAWKNLRGYWTLRDLQELTERELDRLQERVEAHRAAAGRLPAALTELKDLEAYGFRVDDRHQPVDIWDNPFRYEVDGDGYELYSLGRDGRPGGNGLDGDLYPRASGRPKPVATLWQFTADLPTAGIQATCLLAGSLAGIVCLLPVREQVGAARLGQGPWSGSGPLPWPPPSRPS